MEKLFRNLGGQPPPHADHPLTQEEIFEREGLTVEEARRRAVLYRYLVKRRDYPSQAVEREVEALAQTLKPISHSDGGTSAAYQDEAYKNAFYLNSSDAIDIIARGVRVGGKDVLTSAGSGDVAQIFLSQKPSRLRICDLSYVAVFWNEFKLAAVRFLSFEEYQKCFFLKETDRPALLDTAAYEKLRPILSPQCREFFDTFLDYPSWDDDTLHTPREFSGFCRIREYESLRPAWKENFPQTIPCIISKKQYTTLQKSARITPVEIHRKNILDYLMEHPSALPDTVYLTNIDETCQLALAFLRAGARRAYFSLKPFVYTFYQAKDGIHALTALDQLLPENKEKLFEWDEGKQKHYYADLIRTSTKMSRWDLPKIIKGTPLYLDEVKTHVVGYNQDFQFGMIVEVRAEDHRK